MNVRIDMPPPPCLHTLALMNHSPLPDCENNNKMPTVGGGRAGKLPRLKLIGIILETYNLVRNTYVVSENTVYLLVRRPPLILVITAFFCKKAPFFDKNNIFTQSGSMKAVLEIF